MIMDVLKRIRIVFDSCNRKMGLKDVEGGNKENENGMGFYAHSIRKNLCKVKHETLTRGFSNIVHCKKLVLRTLKMYSIPF